MKLFAKIWPIDSKVACFLMAPLVVALGLSVATLYGDGFHLPLIFPPPRHAPLFIGPWEVHTANDKEAAGIEGTGSFIAFGCVLNHVHHELGFWRGGLYLFYGQQAEFMQTGDLSDPESIRFVGDTDVDTTHYWKKLGIEYCVTAFQSGQSRTLRVPFRQLLVVNFLLIAGIVAISKRFAAKRQSRAGAAGFEIVTRGGMKRGRS